MTEDTRNLDAATPLLERNDERRRPGTFGATYQHANGGSVTLCLPSPTERREQQVERGRARTISAVAPLPESCYTINTFMFFLTWFQVLNLLTLTYTDSVINFIAKQFNIPNTMVSFIPSSYQIGKMVVVIPVSYYGATVNRPKAITVGVIVMIIGLGFCILPHFILPSPKFHNLTYSDLCFNHTLAKSTSDEVTKPHVADLFALPDALPCNVHDASTYNPAILLIIGHALFGAGSSPIWPLGVSYIDDHVTIRRVPIYLGAFLCISLLGPVLGFLLGSITSSIYVDLEARGMHESNPGYIGAWWLGYVIIGSIMVVLLFPFYFYPRSLPVSAQKQAEIDEIETLQEQKIRSRTQSRIEATATSSTTVAPQLDTSSTACCSSFEHTQECKRSACAIILSKLAELLCAVKRTLLTPLVLTPVISYLMIANLLSGVTTFGSSYAQTVFNLIRSTSDILIGAVCVPMGVFGTFVGGYLMKRYNFDIRQTLIYTIAMSSSGCFVLVFLFILGCEKEKIAGLNIAYRNSSSISLTGECNSDCFCPKGQFELICDNDHTTYISPCYAGCTAETTEKITVLKTVVRYHNCTCVGHEDKTATSGPCSTRRCSAILAIFVTLVALALMFLCLCQAPIYVVLLRVLETQDKSLGIGLMSFFSRLFGYIPGPIWYGMIMDANCIYWSPKCQGKSDCLLYNTKTLRYSYVGMCFGLSAMYCITFILSFVWMEFNKDHYEKLAIISEHNITDNGTGAIQDRSG